MRKRVLVTGGAGFIPSNFIRHLLDATPYDVVSLDALTYAGNIENLADRQYMEPLGYPGLGRSVRAGVKTSF